LNIVDALLTAAIDNDVHVDGLNFLLRRHPDVLFKLLYVVHSGSMSMNGISNVPVDVSISGGGHNNNDDDDDDANEANDYKRIGKQKDNNDDDDRNNDGDADGNGNDNKDDGNNEKGANVNNKKRKRGP